MSQEKVDQAVAAVVVALERLQHTPPPGMTYFEWLARAAVLAAYPVLSVPEQHHHFHIPNGAVLNAVGDIVRIEPWVPEEPSSVHGDKP